jgi:hypothetical protein
VVRGIAAGCREAGCALIGGEIAELPDFYATGEYDLAGFAVGVVERRRLIDGRGVRPGDAVIGLCRAASSNGYSSPAACSSDSLEGPRPSPASTGRWGSCSVRRSTSNALLRAGARVRRWRVTGGGSP